MPNSIGQEYLQTVIRRLRYYKELGDRSFEQLPADADYHFSPGTESNSIAIIIQHMTGNMLSRWTNFLTEDGEKTWRARDAEFTAHSFTREELLAIWEKGWACLLETLAGLREEDLLREVTIRQEPLTVIDAINRQLAHYPYHIGQIVYLARMIRDQDWKNLSIPRGASAAYNSSAAVKDPAKKF